VTETAPAVHLEDVRFSYGGGPVVLDVAALRLEAGTRTFLHGPSGSGKTTLLGILAGVLRADRGLVRVLGEDLTTMSGARRDAFRARHIGYVFQMFNLIPYLSVLENIVLPVRMHEARRGRMREASPAAEARRLAAALEIDHALGSSVGALSVGQQQRVAACRALIGSPELIIADEPTSSLDHDRRDAFLDLLLDACEGAGSTLVFVSHDRTLASHFEQEVSLGDANRAGGEAA
jgi:putative ABC transport system ATP-binding protein